MIASFDPFGAIRADFERPYLDDSNEIKISEFGSAVQKLLAVEAVGEHDGH